MRLFYTVFLCYLLSAPAAAPAAQTPLAGAAGDVKAGEEKPYHIEADVTEVFTSGADRVLHGIGHVVIAHGDVTINCDEAYSYETQKMATLTGNVRVVDTVQKYTLTSGYAEYHRAKKLAVATKAPVLVLREGRPVTITADLMRMWTDRDYGEAAGNAHIVSEDVVGDGQMLKYFGKENRVELTGEPVMSQRDSRLAAQVITLFLKEDRLDRAIADGAAHLVYFSRPEEKPAGGKELPKEETGEGVEGAAPSGTEAPPAFSVVDTPPAETPADNAGAPPGPAAATTTAASGETPAEDAARSDGEAKEEEGKNAPSGRVDASGAKMEAFFVDGKMDYVDITDEARGHYWPYDELGRETGEQIDAAGDKIRVMMADGDVKKIVVDGNAEGIYRPAASEGRSGVTQTAGDRISVFISDRAVRRIVVYGHARGSYYAEETPAPTAETGEIEKGD